VSNLQKSSTLVHETKKQLKTLNSQTDLGLLKNRTVYSLTLECKAILKLSEVLNPEVLRHASFD